MSAAVVKWIGWLSLFGILLLVSWIAFESLEERRGFPTRDGEPAGPQVADQPSIRRPRDLPIEENTDEHQLDVAHSCHSVFDWATPGCFAALERRYLDAPADRWRPEPILAVAKPLTWREVFASPMATRKAAAIALGNPECNVPNGQIRNDLKSSCAADEVAKLAVLHQACVAALRDDEMSDITDWEREWEFEVARLDREASDQEDYYRRRGRLEDHWYWLSWKLGKCRTVPAQALASIRALRYPSDNSQDERRFPHGQAFELMAAAARLGSEWAQAHYLGDAAHINALARFDVARAYANLARRYYSGSNDQLVYEIVAVKHALRQGMPPDRILLDLSTQAPDAVGGASAQAERILARGWRPVSGQG